MPFWRRAIGLGLAAAVAAALGGCALDREAALRSELAELVLLGETLHFRSRMHCTAAVFDLDRSDLPEGLARATTVEAAVARIEDGAPFLFDMPHSPHAVSQHLMSANLERGLGLLSAGVGPARDCMSDAVSGAYYGALTAPDTRLIYHPAGNALLLVHPGARRAFFLRGNV